MTDQDRIIAEILRKVALDLSVDNSFYEIDGKRYGAAEVAALCAQPSQQGEAVALNIARDESYQRDYIPIGAGWEIQTKGKGSTFRISDADGERRLAIPDSPYLHETLTAMAREVNAFWSSQAAALAVPAMTPALVEVAREAYYEATKHRSVKADLDAALKAVVEAVLKASNAALCAIEDRAAHYGYLADRVSCQDNEHRFDEIADMAKNARII